MAEKTSKIARQSFSLFQRFSITFNVVVSTFCVLALVGMFNYLAMRYSSRTHLAKDTQHQLSGLTQKVLQSLTNEVRVTVLYDPDDVIYGRITELLSEYEANSPHVKVETVNYNQPSRVELIMKTYNLEPNMVRDMVIFDCQGRTEFVSGSQLSDLDMSKLLSGESREVKRVAFKGEMLFTAALSSVGSGTKHVAYFLTGHKEHDPEATNRDGYGEFVSLLSLNNVEPRSLDLTKVPRVPEDCDLLIFAGPETAFQADELSRIQNYLERGGRALVLLNWQSNPGLEPLMAKWGVKIGHNLVRDSKNTLTGRELVTTNFASHAILKPLKGTYLHIVMPRSIERVEAVSQTADAPQVTEIVKTDISGELNADFEVKQGKIETHPNPFQDKKGEIPLAVTVEGGVIPGVKGATRMVVVGDSLFLNNQMINSAGNRPFAVSSVSWLLEQAHLMGGIPPSPIREYQFQLTRDQLAHINYLLLGALPGAILVLGLLSWLRRLR